ncbi:peptidoglycan-binding domain-containing protein [Peribacillus muralis]|uniref:peptidoglycan-binding domain-containing protein n=1 Tax=Peribacillus muralis TaxID=264697 RepID=UPI0036713114
MLHCHGQKRRQRHYFIWILKAALYFEGFNLGSLDSVFGKGTEAALVKFQKAKKITADKKAGKAAFAELFAA